MGRLAAWQAARATWMTLCAGLVLFAPVPVTAQAEPRTPSEPPPALVEARTAHVTLTTDRSPDDANLLATLLERQWRAIARTWFPCAQEASLGPARVAVLTPLHAERLGGDIVAGAGAMLLERTIPVLPERRTVLVAVQAAALEDRAHTRIGMAFREHTAHAMTALCAPQYPAWVQEGLAQVIAAAEFTQTGISLVPAWRLGQPGDRSNAWRSEHPDDDRWIAPNRLLPLTSVRELTLETLATGAVGFRTSASTWALVAALLDRPRHARAFTSYLRALRRGTDEEIAWRRSLERLDVPAGLDAFVHEPAPDRPRIRTRRTEFPAPVIRALRPAEGLLYFIEHMPWRGDAALARVEAMLEQLDGLDPAGATTPHRQQVQAALSAAYGDISEGIVRLDSAIRRHPDSVALRVARLGARLMVTPSRLEPAARGFSARDMDVLASQATTAWHFATLASARVRLSDASAARAMAERALEVDAASKAALRVLSILDSPVDFEASRTIRRRLLALRVHGSARPYAAHEREAMVTRYESQAPSWCAMTRPFSSPAVTPNPTPAAQRTSRPPARGSLSASAIRRVIRDGLGGVRRCYQHALYVSPDTSGRVTVRFIIGSSGRVTAGEIAENTTSSAAVACCTLRHVTTLRFPRPDGGGVVSVTYPFTLRSD